MLVIAGYRVQTNPADLQVSRFDISKAERTASGRMTIELIRPDVRRVDVTWRFLPDAELMAILDAIAAHRPFFEVRFPDVGGEQTILCYKGDITHNRWHTINGVKTWRDVTIPFIEQ